ncbi:MAG: hypothetical protein DRO23_06365 [Thermoprotei archaeon]|nr:MAG: hypothetical protein DRO23_06365 [Thermoprotei archaeon]
MFEQLGELIYIYGPLGVFLVSFLGNVIPYSTIPYLIFVVQYGVAIGNPLIRIGIAVLGGLGAALGKVIVLLIGFAARKVIPEKTKKSMKLFMKLAGKSVFVAVLIFAASPLPDDILYIPLGAMGYSPFKFFAAAVIGKIIITYMALLFGGIIRLIAGESSVLAAIVSLIATIVLLLILVKVNWEKIVEDITFKGWKEFLKEIIRNPLAYIKK